MAVRRRAHDLCAPRRLVKFLPGERARAVASFYRSLRDGKGGRYAAYYAPMVEALACLERDVRSAE